MVNSKQFHIVIGTKAQLIKMAPIMVKLQKRNISYRFILTGQHQETMEKLRENFGIKQPDIVLYQGKDITGILQMAYWLVRILIKTVVKKQAVFGQTSSRDIILVHGDTFSTLLGALMGKISGMQIAHIESGLRSFNWFHPFPEELTRLFVFRLAHIYFCPGKWALDNLRHYRGRKVDTRYNTLLDALHLANKNPGQTNGNKPQEKYAICTLHRFENIFRKERLRWIVETIIEISRQQKILFILHLPTKKQLEKYGLLATLARAKNIELRPRYDYFDFLALIQQSEFVISDGGSNQEECFYLGKPCLLLRNHSERQEGIGKNVIVSQYDPKIITAFVRNYQAYQLPPFHPDISPTQLIVESLLKA